jgi:hypothetical protein
MLSMTSPGLALGQEFRLERELAAWWQLLAGNEPAAVNLLCFDGSSGHRATFGMMHQRPREETNFG